MRGRSECETARVKAATVRRHLLIESRFAQVYGTRGGVAAHPFCLEHFSRKCPPLSRSVHFSREKKEAAPGECHARFSRSSAARDVGTAFVVVELLGERD